ncbi:ABC transporter substrate-binding protein [Anaerostipes sp.]|uniref:ABC transporter substrate-binding protein n=1 Tax=Anaerostipes sp. TaxID=1872530 RepID=UPI0025C0FCD1|nr:ABC transporter substrate-binding protein [Anaerostipes sp.]MBS7009379.1 ABC transporter substrate-binding protein [Anaerostipes sp.]
MKRKCRAAVLLLSAVLFLAACRHGKQKEQEQAKKESYTTMKDSDGRRVKVKKEPERVVALSASLADVWLLSGGELCGATSDVLEEEVVHENLNKKDIRNIGSVKHPDADTILSLKPDLVLVSGSIEEQMEVAVKLKEEDIPYYVVKMNTLDDFLEVLKQMTSVTGEEDSYEEYGEKVRKEADSLLKQVPKGKKQKALVLRAYSTGIKVKTDENVVCEILKDIGIENVGAGNKKLTKGSGVSLEEINRSDPDYIFVTTMGDRKLAEKTIKRELTSKTGWEDLKAVTQKHFVVLPKELFQYKPNSRWKEAYEYLLSVVYPETFQLTEEEYAIYENK